MNQTSCAVTAQKGLPYFHAYRHRSKEKGSKANRRSIGWSVARIPVMFFLSVPLRTNLRGTECNFVGITPCQKGDVTWAPAAWKKIEKKGEAAMHELRDRKRPPKLCRGLKENSFCTWSHCSPDLWLWEGERERESGRVWFNFWRNYALCPWGRRVQLNAYLEICVVNLMYKNLHFLLPHYHFTRLNWKTWSH